LRSGIFCLAIVLGLNGRRTLALALGATLVATSMLEMARANTIYLMLCGLGVFLASRRVGGKAIAALGAAAVGGVLLFGVVEHYRSPGGSGGEKILQYQSVLNRLPYGVTSVYLYVTTPVSNLYYAAARGIHPVHAPYFSLQLLVPTV